MESLDFSCDMSRILKYRKLSERFRALFAFGDFLGVIEESRSARENSALSAESLEWIGYAHLSLGQYDAAEIALMESRALDGSASGVHITLGDIAFRRGNAREALHHYLMAQATGELSIDEHVNLEYVSRCAGEFRIAAMQTEWQLRRNRDNPRYYNRGLLLPRWEGEPLQSSSLLVHWADGFGDNIQHVRFIRELAAGKAHVALDCPRELYRLFVNSFPHIEIILADDDLPGRYDYYTSVLALSAFSSQTCDSVPTPPYLFSSGISRSAASVIESNPGKPLIGVCWRGSDYDRSRSFDPRCLQQLAHLGNLVSLQEAHTEAEDRLLAEYGIRGGEYRFNDFLDTADCIAQLDCVLTIDTAVAHLSGAMGKPTVLLLADPIAPLWTCAAVSARFYPSIVPLVKPTIETWPQFLNRIAPTLLHIVAGATRA